MADDNKPKGPRDDEGSDAASRARNRTVMLTPDITGQVRARLQQDLGSTEGDFMTPTSSGARAPRVELRQQQESHAAVPQPQKPAASVQTQKAQAPLIGFLVSYDIDPMGTYCELRAGRLIITSDRTSASNHLVIEDDTISPMHAILRIAPSGDIQVLDQLSEHGTGIRRAGSSEEELLCGDKSALEHGDMVRFGNRSFSVCVISRYEEG